MFCLFELFFFLLLLFCFSSNWSLEGQLLPLCYCSFSPCCWVSSKKILFLLFSLFLSSNWPEEASWCFSPGVSFKTIHRSSWRCFRPHCWCILSTFDHSLCCLLLLRFSASFNIQLQETFCGFLGRVWLQYDGASRLYCFCLTHCVFHPRSTLYQHVVFVHLFVFHTLQCIAPRWLHSWTCCTIEQCTNLTSSSCAILVKAQHCILCTNDRI